MTTLLKCEHDKLYQVGAKKQPNIKQKVKKLDDSAIREQLNTKYNEKDNVSIKKLLKDFNSYYNENVEADLSSVEYMTLCQNKPVQPNCRV